MLAGIVLLAIAEKFPSRDAARPSFAGLGIIGLYEDANMRIGTPHFFARPYLRTNGIKPQFPNGIVSSVSLVATIQFRLVSCPQ